MARLTTPRRPPETAIDCAFHHGALKLTFTPTSIHGEAICGPAGDTGSNQNDITCNPGDPFDTFQVPSLSLFAGVDVPVRASLVDGEGLASASGAGAIPSMKWM